MEQKTVNNYKQVLNYISERKVNKYDINILELELDISDDVADFSIDRLKEIITSKGYTLINKKEQAREQGKLYIIIK